MAEQRGYKLSGRGVIRCNGEEIARIDQIFIHMHPKNPFLTIKKTPATERLRQVVCDPNVPELEVNVEVNEFVYLAKGAKIAKATLGTTYITDVKIIPLQIEKVKVNGSL